jgi:DNA-binding MarR family transcriptional regulator
MNRKIEQTFVELGGHMDDEMTVRNSWIIGYLCDNKDRDIYQKDIEEHFEIAKSTVAGTLKLMEKKGYIVRSSVESDARLKKIQVTKQGAALHRRRIECALQVEREVRGMLTEAEAEEYMRLTQKLKEKIKESLCRKEAEEC